VSASDPQPSGGRPSKVTLAATLGGASCVVMIFSLFDTLGRLRGVEMRDRVTETLSQPPFDTMAVSTADVLAGMRVLSFVAGALAAAGVVLAVYVARRHQGARIGFTVVAALLLFATPVAGMLTFLVGIAALLLWSEPARAWFGGRNAKAATSRRQEALMSAGDRSSGSSGSSGGSWPYGPQGSDSGSSDAPGSGSAPGDDPPATPWPTQPPPQAPQAGTPQPPPYSGSYGDAGRGEAPGQQPEQQPEQQPWPQGQDQQAQGEPAQGEPGQGDPAHGQDQQSQQAQQWQAQQWQGQQWQGQQPPYGQQPGQGGGYGYPAAQPGQPGQQASYPHAQDQLYGSPYGYTAGAYSAYGSPVDPGKRPITVTVAAVLTFLGALGGLLMGVILMAGLSIDSGAISDQVRRDPSFERMGWDITQVLSALWVIAVIVTLWSLAAMVLAVFVLRRQQWARWLLVVSAVMSALLSLLAILSIVSIVPLLMSLATVVLLFTGGANAWFSGRHGDQQSPPSGPQWSSSPGPW
jgi:hypothetical protein